MKDGRLLQNICKMLQYLRIDNSQAPLRDQSFKGEYAFREASEEIFIFLKQKHLLPTEGTSGHDRQ